MKFLFLILTLILMATEVNCQEDQGSASAGGSIISGRRARLVRLRRSRANLIRKTGNGIKNMRPEISDSTLYKDRKVIEASTPTIRRIFKLRRFYNEEAQRATMAGWMHLRVKILKPEARLSKRLLINFVGGLGKLVIRSDPDKADVKVDHIMLPETTITAVWCTPGWHKVLVDKPGYKPTEGKCEVKAGKITECGIPLSPAK